MKVLVTGATGFLGGWLTKYLLEKNLSVRVLRREKSDVTELKDSRIEHFLGDVTNPESVISAAKGVDCVFHLAGLIAYSRAQRKAMDHVNIFGTENVIQAVKKNSVPKLVHLSSVAAIGASFDKTPLNEESAYNVGHLNLGYFESKKAAEDLVKAAVKRGEITASILNPTTIYGAGDAKKGSRSSQKQVALGKMPYYTSGGANVVAVEDVVHAIYQAWQIGKSGERYILASENLTIHKLFQLIASAAGVQPPRFYLPNPIVKALGWIGDISENRGKKSLLNSEKAWTYTLYHWFDSSKAQRELGFKPRPSRQAIEASVNWMKQQGIIPNNHV